MATFKRTFLPPFQTRPRRQYQQQYPQQQQQQQQQQQPLASAALLHQYQPGLTASHPFRTLDPEEHRRRRQQRDYRHHVGYGQVGALVIESKVIDVLLGNMLWEKCYQCGVSVCQVPKIVPDPPAERQLLLP